jgi:predicted nucleic acid-binding protein
VPEQPARTARGIVDTSVIIGLDNVDAAKLPVEIAISSITLAELAAGPHATDGAFAFRRQFPPQEGGV